MLADLKKDLRAKASDSKAKSAAWFFKTGEGQYGAGDKFLGITVPEQRTIARQYADLPLEEAIKILHSEWHEERLVALFIMVRQFEKGDARTRQLICRTYLANTKWVNNWDLVDSSAPQIVGGYLYDKPRSVLYRLSKSANLWDRRIAILATYYFIKQGEYRDTVVVAATLLDDDQDFIHKAAGWMLREVGNRDLKAEETFLKKYYQRMPRTMLRYAIEKFPPTQRNAYLKGTL